MPLQQLSTLLSTAQVAEHLDISQRTVLAWVQQGRLPRPLRLGKAPQWELHELSKAIDAARAKRDVALNEPKRRMPQATSGVSKGYKSSKELQLMMALKRAQLDRNSPWTASTRRPH